MRYYDSVITSLKYSRDMLIDAKGSDYSGVAAMTAAIEHLEKEHASYAIITNTHKELHSAMENNETSIFWEVEDAIL